MSNKKLLGAAFILAIVSGVVTLVMRSGGIGSTISMMRVGSAPMMETIQTSDVMDTSYPAKGEVATKIMPYPNGGGFAPEVGNRVYQQYASFGVVVKDVSTYIQNMKAFITSQGGIVTSQSLNRSTQYVSAYLNARVPVAKLDLVSGKAIEGVKQVANQNVSANDVTAYQKDMQDLIVSTKRQIAEQQLMRTQAKTDYEKKKIDLEIESLNSQLRSYERQVEDSKDQVAYATFDISAADSMKYFDGQPVGIWDQITTSASSFGGVVGGAIKLAVWIGVYSLVWLPILLIVRWVFGRGKSN